MQIKTWAWMGIGLIAVAGVQAADITAQLDSTDGSSALVVEDSAGRPRMRVDSQGTMAVYSGAGSNLVITSSGTIVAIGAGANAVNLGTAIGSGANASQDSAAVGYQANAQFRGAAVGYQSYGRNSGAAIGYQANGGYGAAVGHSANANNNGAALGREANGSGFGAAVGTQANGQDNGAVVGYVANGYNSGSAVGAYANAEQSGAVLGRYANGHDRGVAVGFYATGNVRGVAVGAYANGPSYSVAVGYNANGSTLASAVGYQANAFSVGSAFGYQAMAVSNGVAIGYVANGRDWGTAVGRSGNAAQHGAALGGSASAMRQGAAVGYAANGQDGGVAMGYAANGSHTNIAIGFQARTSWMTGPGENQIAIGNSVLNDIDNSIRVRGNLYLDGAQGIYYRPTFGDGAFIASPALSITATHTQNWQTAFGWGDHADAGYLGAGSAAAGITAGDTQNWHAAHAWGNHAAAGYADSNTVDNTYVSKAGDTMTGALTINDGGANQLVLRSGGNEIILGDSAVANSSGVAIGRNANALVSGVAVGVGANSDNQGAVLGYMADANNQGIAVGYRANGLGLGAALGWQANAHDRGVAVGNNALAAGYGTAAGQDADGLTSGAALGRSSNARSWGAAVGRQSEAANYGAALGSLAHAPNYGVALGNQANGANTNIAIGYLADAAAGADRVAIGRAVVNEVDDSVRLRGDLYLDGATTIHARPTFGSGAFEQLLPVPPLENVVYVAVNGTTTGPGTIDRPFSNPQLGYNHAATTYAGKPAVVLIAAGDYTTDPGGGGLNMSTGNVHVIGLGRAEIGPLQVAAAAIDIVGKQRIENLVCSRGAWVRPTASGVKFNNCRFQNIEHALVIEGNHVEVHNSFAESIAESAVLVGDTNWDPMVPAPAAPTVSVALYQSSFLAHDPSFAALTVQDQVHEFMVKGCQIAHLALGHCILDLQQSPLPPEPVHLYTHNYIRAGQGMQAVMDAADDTIAFTQNTVLGDVGFDGRYQFYANNIIYGIINNTVGLGGPGWTQAGMGMPQDDSGNTEHSGPDLPMPWLD